MVYQVRGSKPFSDSGDYELKEVKRREQPQGIGSADDALASPEVRGSKPFSDSGDYELKEVKRREQPQGIGSADDALASPEQGPPPSGCGSCVTWLLSTFTRFWNWVCSLFSSSTPAKPAEEPKRADSNLFDRPLMPQELYDELSLQEQEAQLKLVGAFVEEFEDTTTLTREDGIAEFTRRFNELHAWPRRRVHILLFSTCGSFPGSSPHLKIPQVIEVLKNWKELEMKLLLNRTLVADILCVEAFIETWGTDFRGLTLQSADVARFNERKDELPQAAKDYAQQGIGQGNKPEEHLAVYVMALQEWVRIKTPELRPRQQFERLSLQEQRAQLNLVGAFVEKFKTTISLGEDQVAAFNEQLSTLHAWPKELAGSEPHLNVPEVVGELKGWHEMGMRALESESEVETDEDVADTED